MKTKTIDRHIQCAEYFPFILAMMGFVSIFALLGGFSLFIH